SGGVEGQQHRNRACRNVGEALAGGAIELGPRRRRVRRSARIDRRQLEDGRAPIDLRRRDAWALHLLPGRGIDARGEREARYSESAQHDAPHLAGAVVATSGLGWEYYCGSDSRQGG